MLLTRFRVAAWSLFGVCVTVSFWSGHFPAGILAFAFAFSLLILWWTWLEPSNDRVWNDDVARMTNSAVNPGDVVTLQNVRNFDWRSRTDYDALGNCSTTISVDSVRST